MRTPGATITVRFGAPTPVPGQAVSPDVYQKQDVSDTLTGTGINSGFSPTLSGKWEYNGTWAYGLGDTTCQNTNGVIQRCYATLGGVKIPNYLVWYQEGHITVWQNYGPPYYIQILLFGSGKYEVDDAI